MVTHSCGMKRRIRNTLFTGKENIAEAKKIVGEDWTNFLDESSVLVMNRGDLISSTSLTRETTVKVACNEVFTI